MAKNILPVDFKDDIMNSSMDGKRRYKLIQNSDGTYSLEDVTTYDQVGSNFGAGQMNATNAAVNAAADANKIIDDIDTIRAVTQEGYIVGALALKQVDDSLGEQPTFVYDENGKITGYTTKIGGADSVFPFSDTFTLVNTSFTMGAQNLDGVISNTQITKLPVSANTSVKLSVSVNLYAHVTGIKADSSSKVIANNVTLESARTYNLSAYKYVTIKITSREGRGYTSTKISFVKN